MRFEIPFTEKNSREQSIVYFNSIWEKALKKNKKLWYHILIYLPLGVLIIYGKSNLGYLFIVMGLLLLLAYFIFRNNYLKEKERISQSC